MVSLVRQFAKLLGVSVFKIKSHDLHKQIIEEEKKAKQSNISAKKIN